MAKYTDLDEALANPQDVEDGRIHHTGATTPRKAGISCLVGIRLPNRVYRRASVIRDIVPTV